MDEPRWWRAGTRAFIGPDVQHAVLQKATLKEEDVADRDLKNELAKYLKDRDLEHTRGNPYHPMTQGKIERYHRTMKNVVKLRNYDMPWELEREIGRFVELYNHERVHEALDNLTPADVYQGRSWEIRTARERLKQQTLRRRRRYNLGLPSRKEELILPSLIRIGVS